MGDPQVSSHESLRSFPQARAGVAGKAGEQLALIDRTESRRVF